LAKFGVDRVYYGEFFSLRAASERLRAKSHGARGAGRLREAFGIRI